MLKLMFLFCSFQILLTENSGAHSFWVFCTFIKGETPFPEFQSIFMLDDIQFAYYDSNGKFVHRGANGPERTPDARDLAHGPYIEVVHRLMRDAVSYLTEVLNHTSKSYGGNGNSGPTISKYGFNGENGNSRYYNPQLQTLHTDRVWPEAMDSIWPGSVHLAYALYHPHCIDFIKTNLAKEKHRVLKKLKPRVRLFQKTLSDSEGAKVTCLATGFYPRHINLTLLRDGQPVSDHQITGGELLPNGDETYQMRKSMVVSTEGLKMRHKYSCTAEHLSLDNKLDITLDLHPGMDTESAVLLVAGLGVALLLLCVTGAVVARVVWRRRCAGKTDEQRTAHQKTDQQQKQHQTLL